MSIDHRSFVTVPAGEASPRAQREAMKVLDSRKHWWMEENQEDVARAVFAALAAIQSTQRSVKSDYEFYSRMFGERDPFVGSGGVASVANDNDDGTLPENVILQVIETRQSRVCKNRPRPAFVTSGGSWRMRNKAKKLNKFCQGLFYETNIDEIAPQVWLDDEKCGLGAVKVFERDGRVCAERVLPYELTIDEQEAKYRKPHQMFQEKTISKIQLLADFPDFADAIETAGMSTNGYGGLTPEGFGAGDMVQVVEAWHLPTNENTKDGMHAVCIQGATLFVERWEDDCFPFAFHITRPPSEGFRGQGMVERLMGGQMRINRLHQVKDEHFQFLGTGKWMEPRTARVQEGAYTNEVGGVVKYDGPVPPQLVSAPFIPPEYFTEPRLVKEEMFKEGGVSDQAVSGKKPAGVNSAPAQRTYDEITSERLTMSFRAFEKFHMDLARLQVDCARRISARKAENDDEKRGEYRVRLPNKNRFDEIDWATINLDEDSYIVQVTPISSLPTTYTGRLETVMEWVNLGWVSAESAMRLMDIPDIEAEASLNAAALDNADWTIDLILESGKYREPDPYTNLELHHTMSLKAYNKAVVSNYPEKRLELLRQYIDAIARKKTEMMAAAAPPSPPQGMPPGPMQQALPQPPAQPTAPLPLAA
jgi:hypothetical protein